MSDSLPCGHPLPDTLPCELCLARGHTPCADCLESLSQQVCPVCADRESEHSETDARDCWAGRLSDLGVL